MANEEDECDSSRLFTIASQSDVTSFLRTQAAKITGLNSSISDDDEEDSINDTLLARFTDVSSKNCSISTKPYLSRSCFASISSSSSEKINSSADLTELKWLNSYKLKEFKEDKITNQEIQNRTSQLLNSTEDRIGQLSNELKTYDYHSEIISDGVLLFLALYSKHDDQEMPWSLTIKQIYEYIQIHLKRIIHRRGWKSSLKQTLTTIPCFIKVKHELLKSRSVWTIDPYYRPLLTKAYLTNLSLSSTKSINENDEKQIISLDINDSSKSIVDNFAPKATLKTKALPRLYERLCEENGNKLQPTTADKDQKRLITDRKRPRSNSSSGHWQVTTNNNHQRLSSSSPWTKKSNKYHHQVDIEGKTSMLTKASIIITPCPSIDHMYLNQTEKRNHEPLSDEDDECDSGSIVEHTDRKSRMTTRSLTNDLIHRRKSLPSTKCPSRRPNTRINRKIIEQDLELLRQATVKSQPVDLSIQQSLTYPITSIDDDVLDLSLTR